MSAPVALRKPKVEKDNSYGYGGAAFPAVTDMGNQDENEEQYRDEREETMVALIEHRTKEVEHLRKRVSYYKTQLEQAEKRLEDTQLKLAHLRCKANLKQSQITVNGVKIERRSSSPIQIIEHHSQNNRQSKAQLSQDGSKSSKIALGDSMESIKLEQRSFSLVQISEGSSGIHPQSKPPLVIPSVNLKISHSMKVMELHNDVPSEASAQPSTSLPTMLKGNKSHRIYSAQEVVGTQSRGTKRKSEQKDHRELIPLIGSCSSPSTFQCQTDCVISSRHKRKLRSLILCPTNYQRFVTSALDGVVNLWQIQDRGSSANLLSTTDCLSQKKRRWPEDIAWHPQRNSLFSVYSADGGDSQISILNLDKAKENRVSFLEEKPHVKGIINSIMFMPWDDNCFATGGSDHAVVLWTEKDEENLWKPETLHKSWHSSAVMGVAGLLHKQIVLSVGADKRIVGVDVFAGRGDYKHLIDSKCMSVLPNPCDFNLFVVQTGTPERQLRLFDIRSKQTEIHAFGWKQESSESQSALINQAWSPDGLYITSGSADPIIHMFDIRYNAHKPSKSIRAHQKRVFKAVWHDALPLLISISSDLNIGLHKVL